MTLVLRCASLGIYPATPQPSPAPGTLTRDLAATSTVCVTPYPWPADDDSVGDVDDGGAGVDWGDAGGDYPHSDEEQVQGQEGLAGEEKEQRLFSFRPRESAGAGAEGLGEQEAEEAEDDPWAMLDPYDRTGESTRPMKKGRCHRLPPALRRSSRGNRSRGAEAATDVSASLAGSSLAVAVPLGTERRSARLQGLAFSEFQYLASRERKRLNQQRRKDRKETNQRRMGASGSLVVDYLQQGQTEALAPGAYDSGDDDTGNDYGAYGDDYDFGGGDGGGYSDDEGANPADKGAGLDQDMGEGAWDGEDQGDGQEGLRPIVMNDLFDAAPQT